LPHPSRPPRWNKQFFVQLAWILVTVGAGYAVLFGAALVQLCHTVENRSDRFYARCNSPIQRFPLVGIIVLVVGYVIAHRSGKPWIRGVSLVIAFVPLAITTYLFNV
jgi:lysylphosphatidylglycerol synthetase-like protein (DUF2156 family)